MISTARGPSPRNSKTIRFYKTCSTRSVIAQDLHEAARIAMKRLARRAYGRCAKIGALRYDCAGSTDGGFYHTFEGYIGRRLPTGGVSGHNVWLSVYDEGAIDDPE